MTHTPTYEDLVEALKQNQQVLQVFNYQFVKDQFYRNAEVLKAAEQNSLLALAQHIAEMADDAYLIGHPEWVAIAEEARAALAQQQKGDA